MKILHRAGALALALALLCAPPALAETGVGKQIQAPAGYVPSTAIYCDNGSGVAALCSLGGGSGTSGPVTVTTGSDASGTTSGTPGTYTTALAASATRKDCLFQNTSTSSMSFRVGGSTVFQISAGGTFGCTTGTIVDGRQIEVSSTIASATYSGTAK